MAKHNAKQKTSMAAEPVKHAALPDYDAALKLLDEWLADESGYNEEVWPKIENGLQSDSD